MLGKILVCDDDAQVRRALALLLQETYAVVEAPSGEDALHLAEDEKPNLVLLDVSMPGLGGLETLRRLRAAHPGLPAVMLSGKRQLGIVRRALALGARSYVTKPFDAEAILAEVALALGRRDTEAGGRPWRIEGLEHGTGAAQG